MASEVMRRSFSGLGPRRTMLATRLLSDEASRDLFLTVVYELLTKDVGASAKCCERLRAGPSRQTTQVRSEQLPPASRRGYPVVRNELLNQQERLEDLRFQSNGLSARHDVMRLAEELIHLSGWQPGQPLELLPVLREQYPGGIRDEILSVCLLIRERTWFIRIIETGNDALRSRDIDLLPLVDDGDNYDYSDCPAHEPLWVIDGLLQSTDRLHTACLMDIFTPAMLGFLERFERRSEQVAIFSREDNSTAIDFLLSCATLLSEPLADQVNLSELTIQKLKTLPSPVEEYTSYWEILVARWHADHLMAETFRTDLRDVTAEVFHALPDAQRLALWISHRQTADGLKELAKYGDIPADVSALQLHDLDLLFQAAEPAILYEVNEEACRWAEAADRDAAQRDLWSQL